MDSSSNHHPYQPPEPNETLSAPPNYRFHEASTSPEKKQKKKEKPPKPKKKKRVKLIVGDKTAKKSSATEDVELYDILQALRAEDMIRLRGPTGPGKDTVVAALYDYCIQRTHHFQRGDIFWLPPMQGVVPVEDSLYGDLVQCLDIMQDSSIVQDSPEERWEKDEMLMEYKLRIDIEMEFMKPLLIVDYSLITFVSADAQTEFERFLSHLMLASQAKVIKIETSSGVDDPLSAQSQSTGESTNSSSEALTEIIKFLEEEDRREQQQQRKAASDRSAMSSSLAYSEEGSLSNLQSESGATVGSGMTADSSLLAGTKLVGSLMEEVTTASASAMEHRTTIIEEEGEGEPSSEEHDDDDDEGYTREDYYFTTPPSPKSKTIRSIANKKSSSPQKTTMTTTTRSSSPVTTPPPRQEDYRPGAAIRTRSFGSSHNSDSIAASASTVPAGTASSPKQHAVFGYRFPRTDSGTSQANTSHTGSHDYSHNSHTGSHHSRISRTDSYHSHNNNSSSRVTDSKNSPQRSSSTSSNRYSPLRRKRKTNSSSKRQVQDDEESYFSYSSGHQHDNKHPTLDRLLCGLDMGDASKLLRRFFCFY